jgi:hypothetical protein
VNWVVQLTIPVEAVGKSSSTGVVKFKNQTVFTIWLDCLDEKAQDGLVESTTAEKLRAEEHWTPVFEVQNSSKETSERDWYAIDGQVYYCGGHRLKVFSEPIAKFKKGTLYPTFVLCIFQNV